MADKVIGLLEKVKIYTVKEPAVHTVPIFTLVAVAVMISVAAGFSQRFVKSTERWQSSITRMSWIEMNLNLDTYLHNMMKHFQYYVQYHQECRL